MNEQGKQDEETAPQAITCSGGIRLELGASQGRTEGDRE